MREADFAVGQSVIAAVLRERHQHAAALRERKDTEPFKDGISDSLEEIGDDAVSPLREGTKCAALRGSDLGPGGAPCCASACAATQRPPLDDFDAVWPRRAEADEFYAALQADIADPDARLVQRQAFAGMIWSKQFYRFDVRAMAAR